MAFATSFSSGMLEGLEPEGPISYYASSASDILPLNDWNDIIDPQLDTPYNSIDSQTPWNSQHFQRFLISSPQNRTQSLQSHDLPRATSHPDFLPNFPPRSNGRHGSPFSQHQSSTCSTIQSPPAESDIYPDGVQCPSTPQDMTAASPFITTAPYDHWDGHSVQLPLSEQAYIHSTGCVNPSALSPGSVAQADSFKSHSADAAFQLGQVSIPDTLDSSYYPEALPSGDGLQNPSGPKVLLGAAKDEIHVKRSASSAPYPNFNKPDGHVMHGQFQSNFEARETLGKRKRSLSSKDVGPRGVQKRRPRGGSGSAKRQASFSMSSPSNAAAMLKDGKHCDQCNSSFKDDTLLRKHKKTEHVRPFACVFHYAGCTSTFATKNEWKRHVASQHLSLTYWLCTHGNCAHSRGPSTHQRSASLPAHGVIFNRKDLFTQHIRRMHSSDNKNSKYKKGASPQLDDRLKKMQDEAFQQRCTLPTYMRCPADNCTTEFRGLSAWDERMEHVARHLEASATGEEPAVIFGGLSDHTLTAWAEQVGVDVVKRTATGWETCNPLKGEGGSRKVGTDNIFGDEEDAEGEMY